MSKMDNHIVGMEEEGKLIYDSNKREYVPAGLTPRKDVQKHRKQRMKRRRSK